MRFVLTLDLAILEKPLFRHAPRAFAVSVILISSLLGSSLLGRPLLGSDRSARIN